MGGGISGVIGALALLGFLGFLAGIGLVVVAASQGRPIRGGIILAAGGLVIGVLLSVVSQGIIVVQPQEVAVVFQTLNGELEENPRRAGTHIIIPVLQEATIYPIRQQELTMSTSSEEARGGDNAITALTIDGQEVNIDVTVFFNIDPAQANLIHQRWQDDYLNRFVLPTVRNLVRNKVSAFRAEAIYGSDRVQMESEAEDDIRNAFDEEGLELTGFLVRGIQFTTDFRQSIEEKEIEEQRLQRAETEAQRVETVARGQANAVIEAARGDAEAVRIQARAQADALAVISEQLAANPLLIQYEYIQNLSENISLALIPSNSPFLFDFNSIEGLPSANPNFQSPVVPELISPEDEGTDSSGN